MQILWILDSTFLVFQKGIFLLQLFVSLSFLSPTTSFQTVESHLPDRASIFGQFTFLQLSTELILVSSGERVSVSVEPCWSDHFLESAFSLQARLLMVFFISCERLQARLLVIFFICCDRLPLVRNLLSFDLQYM